MAAFFDMEKLEPLLKDFYELSRIRITVFDENMNELASWPEKVAPYCAVIRGVPRGLSACLDCDREACRRAAKTRHTYVYRCHAGLTEAVAPLYVGEVLAGYLLFGHVFSYPSLEEGWEEIDRRCFALKLNRHMLKDAVFSALPCSEAYVRSAAHILKAVASWLILERMATLKEDLLPARLDSFLSAHYTENINAAGIASALGIGRTQLYELSAQLYGCGIAGRIRAMRLERAKELLLSGKELPLAEVASQSGFGDYNYFITMFSRSTGMPPGEYRRRGGAGLLSG